MITRKTIFFLATLSFPVLAGEGAIVSYSVNPVHPLKQAYRGAFNIGEELTYKLHYGFVDAGRAILQVTSEERKFSGRPTFHVVGTGKSIGAFDWFFKVRDRYESFIDREALVPYLFLRNVDEGGYKINQQYVFDPIKGEVNDTQKKHPVPEGVQDMISAFYFARNLDFSKANKGDVFTIQSFVDGELFPLKIRYIGKYYLETELGTIRCVKFRPIIQKGRVFKNEEDLNVWISDDKNHIPIRAQAEVLVGSIKLDLIGHKGLAGPMAIIKQD